MRIAFALLSFSLLAGAQQPATPANPNLKPKLEITFYESFEALQAKKITFLARKGTGKDHLRKLLNEDACVEREMFELSNAFESSKVRQLLTEGNPVRELASERETAVLTLSISAVSFTPLERREAAQYDAYLHCSDKHLMVKGTLTYTVIKLVPNLNGDGKSRLHRFEWAEGGRLLATDTVSIAFDKILERVVRNVNAKVTEHVNKAQAAKEELEKNANHPVLEFL